MIKSDTKRNSQDTLTHTHTHTHIVLSSVCLLLASTQHAQIASLYLCFHPQPCVKTPPSTLFSFPLSLSILSHTHTRTQTHKSTSGKLQEMWNICLVAEHIFCRVSNEHTGLWWGLGSMVLLPCPTCYNQPSHLLCLCNSPEHDPYPVCGVFLERLCHTWQLSTDQAWWELTWHGRSQAWMCLERICNHSPHEVNKPCTKQMFLILFQVWRFGVC